MELVEALCDWCGWRGLAPEQDFDEHGWCPVCGTEHALIDTDAGEDPSDDDTGDA